MNLATQLESLGDAVYPSAIGIVLALLFLVKRRYYASVGLSLSAILWLALCSSPAFAVWMENSLKEEYPPNLAVSYPKADAIVILGGGKLPGRNFDWTSGATRLGFGLQLYRTGCAPIIVLSGGENEATRMANGLVEQGVGANALRVEDLSSSTHENALYSARILQGEKLHIVLLVTSALHMPRAAAAFRKQGVTVIPAPALADAGQAPPRLRSFGWPLGTLYLSSRCMREYFGLWTYKLLGWA
jgi:uncharacterized SAM-binding protein YcdF (DUF218 family)